MVSQPKTEKPAKIEPKVFDTESSKINAFMDMYILICKLEESSHDPRVLAAAMLLHEKLFQLKPLIISDDLKGVK